MKPPARQLAVALTLVAVTLLAYANSFGSGFPLDNKALILQDTRVHAATRDNVDLILNHTYWWPIGESGLYRPVTTLSYLLNYAVLGNSDRPAGYHAFNLLVHVINVLLVYAVSRRLEGPLRAFVMKHWSVAFAIAAVWAVHPLSTEAVTNIVGRADLLAALAVLSGLLMYVKSTEATGTRRLLWLAMLAAATTLGVFAKESAVVIAGVIALYSVTLQRMHARGEPLDKLRMRGEPKASERAWVRSLLAAELALAVPLMLLWYQRSIVLGAAPPAEFPFVDNPIVGAGFWTGRLTALAVTARYGWLALWPMTLSPDYSYAQIPLATGRPWEWVAWTAVAIAAAATFALWRHDRTAGFFAAFAFVTLLPASNLFFPAGTIMAERVMYLPSVGVVGFVVLALSLAAQRARMPALAVVAVCVIVAGFALRTWDRNTDWRSDLTLWSSAVDAAPLSFKAHRALAEALYEQDSTHANIARVVDEIEKSVVVIASLPHALNDSRTYRQAGAYYLEQGDWLRVAASGKAQTTPAESIRAYEKAVPMLLRCLAIIDAARGPSTAMPRADAYRVLSAVYTRLHEAGNAVDAAARARGLDPMNPVSYQQAAAAFLAADRGDDAAVALMVGSMVTGNRALRDELVDLYRRGLDPRGCAVASTPNGPAIDPSCETVRTHVCRATVEAIDIHQHAGRADEARRLQDGAARQFRCP